MHEGMHQIQHLHSSDGDVSNFASQCGAWSYSQAQMPPMATNHSFQE